MESKSASQITAQGYCFYNNQLFVDATISNIFVSVKDFDSFCSLVEKLNGVFSVCLQYSEVFFLFVSPGGFNKLFYCFRNNNFLVSSKASDLSEEGYNDEAMFEYQTSLFCWGNKTLFRNVFSVEPGYALSLNKTVSKHKKIFNYAVSVSQLNKSSYSELKIQGKNILEKVSGHLIQYLNGRQAVVPLSGGYDSRFILAALVLKGYKNIVAVTYGLKGIPDYINAEKAASQLGVAWYAVPYSPEEISSRVLNSDLDSYFEFMVNGNAFPSMHEIIAVSKLKSEKKIEENAVFIPGHSGDFLGGSQYVKVFSPDLKYADVPNALFLKKFDTSFYSKKEKHEKTQQLLSRIKSDYSSNEIPATIFEDIDMSEKLSKHILNAAHAYNYFGYSSYFPFWDNELIEFFKHIASHYKIEKRLYDDILKSFYFEPLNISFEKELNPSVFQLKIQLVKNLIRPYFPNKVKKFFTQKNDYYLYQILTKSWLKKMEEENFIKKGEDYSFNTIIANWVIFKMRNLR